MARKGEGDPLEVFIWKEYVLDTRVLWVVHRCSAWGLVVIFAKFTICYANGD